MRQWLIDGGYDEHDVTLWSGPQVATGARELQQSASVIARIFGAELTAMDKHIELADAGYTFLVAYSPSDLNTKCLMNVARSFGYVLAQKYDRCSITALWANPGVTEAQIDHLKFFKRRGYSRASF
jgi:hypothetical protein